MRAAGPYRIDYTKANGQKDSETYQHIDAAKEGFAQMQDRGAIYVAATLYNAVGGIIDQYCNKPTPDNAATARNMLRAAGYALLWEIAEDDSHINSFTLEAWAGKRGTVILQAFGKNQGIEMYSTNGIPTAWNKLPAWLDQPAQPPAPNPKTLKTIEQQELTKLAEQLHDAALEVYRHAFRGQLVSGPIDEAKKLIGEFSRRFYS
jgi:hypothetical protein